MQPLKVTSAEFEHDFARFQDAARRAPVEISKDGRPHTVMISSDLFELLQTGRIARTIDDLDAETAEAILGAAVDPEHDRLDDLIKDWTP